MTNDDGISVYDVTSAPRIRYAFFFPGDPNGESILSAQQYLDGYPDAPQENNTAADRAFWDQFAKLDIIDAAALESAWPGSKFQDQETNLSTSNSIDNNAELLQTISLKEAATAKLVMEAFQSDPSELEWLDDAERVADMASAVKAKLLEQPDVVHLPSGVTLLARCVCKDSTYIDLTPYHSITSEEVCLLIETFAANASAKKTYELVLPDIESMRASDLQRLVNIGTIRSLHLGTTPHIRLAAAMKLLAASSITHFTHPVLYARCFDLTIGTQFATPEKSWSKIFPCGDGTNFPLRQLVYVTTGTRDADIPRLRGGGLHWSKFNTASPNPDAAAIAMPLEDALMAPDRLMKFIPMALGRLVNMRDYHRSGTSLVVTGIAKQSALARNNFVSCVPGMTLATWTKVGSSSAERSPKAQFLAPGEWTLVLCHERNDRAGNGGFVVRYAFASMDKDKKSVIVSAADLFAKFSKDDSEVAGRLLAEWQATMAGINLCSAEEVLEALTLALGVEE